MDYWALASAELTCSSCGWVGSGSLATVGELFEQLAEYCCPECGKKIVVVQFPTREETAAAASRGNAEAIVAMEQWAQRDTFWRRLEESQRAPIEWPAWLDSGDVACALHLDSAGGDTWMVLSANGLEIHREIAAYESPEPLARLGAAVKQHVGERLKAFDYAPRDAVPSRRQAPTHRRAGADSPASARSLRLAHKVVTSPGLALSRKRRDTPRA